VGYAGRDSGQAVCEDRLEVAEVLADGAFHGDGHERRGETGKADWISPTSQAGPTAILSGLKARQGHQCQAGGLDEGEEAFTRASGDPHHAADLMVDVQPVAKIGHAQQIEEHIAPGRHEIYLKRDWCESVVITVEAAPGEVIGLQCEPTASAGEDLNDVVIQGRPYIRLTRLG
jgi:hypothetical protein